MSDWNQRSRGNYGNQGGGYGKGEYRDPPEDRSYEFPNSGALFPTRDKKSENSPDFSGNIVIADDVLDYILREAERDGEGVKMELKGWVRMGRNNNNFTSIKLNIPYGVRMEQEGNPTFRGRPNYNQQRQTPPQRQASQRQDYGQQSGRSEGGRFRTDPQPRRPPPSNQEEFQRGDRMPDFLRDDDDDPHKPPF